MKYISKKLVLLYFLLSISFITHANFVKIEMMSYMEGKSVIYLISNKSIKIYKKVSTFKILVGCERMTKNEYNNFIEIKNEVNKALMLNPPNKDFNSIDGFSWNIEFEKDKKYTIHSTYNVYFDKLIEYVNNLLKTKNRIMPLTNSFK